MKWAKSVMNLLPMCLGYTHTWRKGFEHIVLPCLIIPPQKERKILLSHL